MTAIQLKAVLREVPTAEKNVNREKGQITAEFYGHKIENKHLFLNEMEFGKIFAEAGGSSLVDLTIGEEKPVKVLIHEVQHDPVSGQPIHVDLYGVKMDEELQTNIPLTFEGESKAVKEMGGTLVKSLEEIEISCLPADLISEIKVDISSLVTFDDVIRVADLQVPETIKILTDVERTVATAIPIKIEEEKPAEGPAEGEEKPAEGAETKPVEEEEKKEG